METYYVTQEQLDLLEKTKKLTYPLTALISINHFQKDFEKVDFKKQKDVLRYLGGDETIEFKVKETLYRLWRSVDYDDNAYMKFTSSGTPDWTVNKYDAFTAPLEEIKKWKTPAWEIEEAN